MPKNADMLCLNQTEPSLRCSEPVVAIDPLNYPGWDSLLAAHPDASFYHSSAWARVLCDTYGHRPLYFCRIGKGLLEELLPVVEVASAWTGRRGVSLPFTDAVPALPGAADCHGEPCSVYEAAMDYGSKAGWKYLECRGNGDAWVHSVPSVRFWGHVIDLQPREQEMFLTLDSSTRRGIRKAMRSGVRVEFARSSAAMRAYYKLHCLTRKRHGIPPQPFCFFENISQQVVERGHGFVALGFANGHAVAGAVYFFQGRQAFFKFGASDYGFQSLRANDLVMWEAIKRCAADGFAQLLLGRTSLANEGLRRFKTGFGAREERIEYQRYDFRRGAFVTSLDRAKSWVNPMFRLLPNAVLRLVGRLLYSHVS